MRALLPLLAGFGLALFVSGLAALRRGRLARRVEPYLRGLPVGGRTPPEKPPKNPRMWRAKPGLHGWRRIG
jgi:hypothetical protein